MAPFFSASSNVQRDPRKVPVLANLGALWCISGVPLPWYNTLPFPFQRLDAGTPPQPYQLPIAYPPFTHDVFPPTLNDIHYVDNISPVMLPPRETTPSSTDLCDALHPLNEANATRHVAPVEDGNEKSTSPRKRRAVADTAAVGPSCGATRRRQRSNPYTRPTKVSISPGHAESVPSESGHPLSAIALGRLTMQGTCKLEGCRETFTSVDVYLIHIREYHGVKPGKNGNNSLPCLWDGCGIEKSKATLWNHTMAHNIKTGCAICDSVFTARKEPFLKHLKDHGKPSHTGAQYGYVFFCKSDPA